MLSAFIISPLILFASLRASFDFPEAVGPANKISILGKVILFLHQDNVFD